MVAKILPLFLSQSRVRVQVLHSKYLVCLVQMNYPWGINMRDEKLTKILKKHFHEFDTTGFNPLDFMHRFGSPIEALLYSKLIWPDFIEIEGMVFLKNWIEDEDDARKIKAALQKNHGDKALTEKSFNSFEISFFFGSKADDANPSEYLELAKALQQSWSTKLSSLFPSLKYLVEIIEPNNEQEVGIIFYRA